MKQALCYRPAANTQFPEQWDTFLMPRSVVDNPEALDPSIQQILPYITFFRPCEFIRDNESMESLEVLTYRRASGSGETRLIGKRSLGFGGHIDTLPGDNFLEHIYHEAAREIFEELGIKLNAKAFYISLIGSIRAMNLLVINDGTVNAVHTGIAIMLNFEDHAKGEEYLLEDGHIEDPKFINVMEIAEEEIKADYETWSQVVINGLRGNVNEFHRRHEEQARLMQLMEAAQANGGIMPMAEGPVEQTAADPVDTSVTEAVGADSTEPSA